MKSIFGFKKIIDATTFKMVEVFSSQYPEIYGLTNTHKSGTSLRSIPSICNLVQQIIAQ